MKSVKITGKNFFSVYSACYGGLRHPPTTAEGDRLREFLNHALAFNPFRQDRLRLSGGETLVLTGRKLRVDEDGPDPYPLMRSIQEAA
jgi:hypothetical protein